jgi:hypothetical protein
MSAVNGVGEPCAGEPHARFEVAGAGNGHEPWPRALGRDNQPGNRRHLKAPGPTAGNAPRQLPTLPRGAGRRTKARASMIDVAEQR